MTIVELPTSPVTGNKAVRQCDRIEVSDVVRLYRDQARVDVSRFFRGLKEVSVLECRDTGYRFFYPFSVAGDEGFYQELGADASAAGLDYDRDWSDDHENASGYVGPTSKLLEIGCNSGKFLKRISRTTADVHGLEFNEVAAGEARKKGLDISGESVESYSLDHLESFDVVCAFQVLEHVSDVKSFLDSALRALRSGGKLILSVPNNDPYFQRFNKYETMNLPPHHVGLWNIRSFEALHKFFGMDLVKHTYTAVTSFRGDAYLRTRKLAGVKSLPRAHSTAEMAKMLAVGSFALFGSTLDFLRGKSNYAHITVVFEKR